MSVFAQIPAPYYPLNSPHVEIVDTSAIAKSLSAILKAPAPGIYRMPLDHMPCIVPDTKEIIKMPNAWKGKIAIPFIGTIPNPGIPLRFFSYKRLSFPILQKERKQQ